jgi:hypothetical protein
MEISREYELVVSEGKLPIWKVIVAAAFFTAMCYLIYADAKLLYYIGISESTCTEVAESLWGISFCLAGGIAFAITKTVLIDVEKDKLISRFDVGPFTRETQTDVPELEYVSVFLDSKDWYQVNLWYKGNKHYKMYVFETKVPAMKFAGYVVEKLKIDLLDATEKGNSKWMAIDKS